jgi:hypothetical protein
MKHGPILIALLALAACGENQSPTENTAEQLEEAADQSTDPAAEVLENAADRIEGGNAQNAASAAQEALEKAGNAQVPGAWPPPGTSQPVDNLANSY